MVEKAVRPCAAVTAPHIVSVLGLGFGDCGKGKFIDFLSRHWQAHTVVRFNGGAQAGHNVVLPDGRHHTFSQFGAATFQPGVATVLAYPVVVHPTALLVEHACLQRAGVTDALQRLHIDARCRVTTPFHQAAGRLSELARGSAAHGTCGVGVGATVGHGIDHPDQVLRYADLVQPAVALEKLQAIRLALLARVDRSDGQAAARGVELQVLQDESMAARWLERTRELTRIVRPAAAAQVAARLHRPGTILFEGAQGILLDEWRGFHPHTTWSSTGAGAVDAVLADAGQTARVRHLGVLRTYMTRHGNGPLPTHDRALDCLAEPHNGSDGWQGAFRRGHPDAVLLRYALSVAGPLDGLLLSHLDVFDRAALRWCTSYAVPGSDGALRPGPAQDLDHQRGLTRMLAQARPVYDAAPVSTAQDCIERITALAGLPILFGSAGPDHASCQKTVG